MVWSKKEEALWEAGMGSMVAELMQLCGDLPNQALISGTCLELNRTVTGNTDVQTSAFLRDGTSDWHILKLAWFGKGRQDCVFWGVLKGMGLNSRNLPLF